MQALADDMDVLRKGITMRILGVGDGVRRTYQSIYPYRLLNQAQE